MARLTYKNGWGKMCFLVVWREITGNAAEKLAQYEDLGDPSELQRIKRGTWEECDYKELQHGFIETTPKAALRCSNCKRAFKKNSLTERSFCPCCGADMRSDEEMKAAK